MGKNPAFQYYPTDFDRDTSALSLSSTGAWIRLLNVMWFAQNRGEITLSIVDYARLLRATVEQTVAVLNELIEHDVCDAFSEQGREQHIATLRAADSNVKVTLVNRRMDREERARKLTASRVAKFRREHCNGHSNADVTSPSSVLQSSFKEKEIFKEKENGAVTPHEPRGSPPFRSQPKKKWPVSAIRCGECGTICHGEQDFEEHFHEQHVKPKVQS